eukprot:gnl/TRDRNA2_/TRDRNA2_182350_c0_seq1.p1 gnl/TRDRNA2_/TRDRNA2_182350_c0~~gnl/TRDRNA2_/TRDRNA2_182350_c0_seq1.p1  ORF type:complete len:302 (+),score=69.92 gnl/TRDRNA2_/TRDRNA2_182350_c0_seq1:72-908(+)
MDIDGLSSEEESEGSLVELEDAAVPDAEKPVASSAPLVAEGAAGSKNKLKPEEVVRALHTSIKDRTACLQGCCTLEAETQRSSTCHKRVLSAGGAEALTSVMDTHKGDPEVQIMACRTLQHLAATAATNGAELIARAGGCQAIVAAMAAHPADALLQQVACHALELIAFGGSVPKARAVSDGAPEALVQTLKMHHAATAVLQAALAALQAMIEGITESVSKAGGISAVTAALVEHKGDQQVQYWGRLLLQVACGENFDIRREVLRTLHYQGIEMDLVG